MCNHCDSKNYGQDQPLARAADKARLDKVLKARQDKAQRKENAHLN